MHLALILEEILHLRLLSKMKKNRPKSNETTIESNGVITRLRRKPGGRREIEFASPLPPPMETDCCTAVFNGLTVEVASIKDMQHLHRHGCHGKSSYFRGTPQVIMGKQIPSPAEEKDCEDTTIASVPAETLTLSLEEAFFLSYYLNNVLRIINAQGEVLQWPNMLQQIESIQANFLHHLAAYIHLRSLGWVVKSGFKFGSEFLIYKFGPHSYHGSYVVAVIADGDTLSESRRVRSLHRVAHSNGKDLVLLRVDKPPNFKTLQDLKDISSFTVQELMLRRFLSTLYVQNQNTII